MGGFSKGQKRIAAYILENYDKAAFMTASRLGILAGVSESTVVRFASELGYDGYPSMQRALQDMIRSRLTSTQRIQAAGDMFQDVLPAVIQSDIDKLRQMQSRSNQSEFDRVVDKLIASRHVYILGVRSSSFVAGYLHFYMHLLSENVTLIQSNAAGEMFEQMLRMGPGDVMIGQVCPGPGGGDHRHHGQRALPGVPALRRGAAGALRDDLLRGLHGGAPVPDQRAAGGAVQPVRGGRGRHLRGAGEHLERVRRVWKDGR